MNRMISQLNLVVHDMEGTLAFYRRFRLEIDVTPSGQHASAKVGALLVEWDTVEFARRWDTGWRDTGGGATVIGFAVDSRDDVDAMYHELVAGGARVQQPPYDAFWGSRYAIVEDPDGRPVGIMSPEDASKKFWPPSQPPRS